MATTSDLTLAQTNGMSAETMAAELKRFLDYKTSQK